VNNRSEKSILERLNEYRFEQDFQIPRDPLKEPESHLPGSDAAKERDDAEWKRLAALGKDKQPTIRRESAETLPEKGDEKDNGKKDTPFQKAIRATMKKMGITSLKGLSDKKKRDLFNAAKKASGSK